MVSLWDDVLRSTDEGNPSFRILLDMSAAFDTIIHKILLERLHADIGVSTEAMAWFSSFLSDRKQSGRLGSFRSKEREVGE